MYLLSDTTVATTSNLSQSNILRHTNMNLHFEIITCPRCIMKTSTWFYDRQKLLHTALHFQMPTLSILPIDTFSKCGMCSVLNVLVSGCCTSAKTQPPHKMPHQLPNSSSKKSDHQQQICISTEAR